MHEVVVVGQGPETVDPQPDPFNLGAVDPWIALDPVGSAEWQRDEDDDDGEGGQGPLPRQRALPVNVRVREDVVLLLLHHLEHNNNQVVCPEIFFLTTPLWQHLSIICLAVF